MADVAFGFVHDFGPREEWWARRGAGRLAERRARSTRRSASAADATAGSRCWASSPPIRAGSRPRSTRWSTAPTACARSARSPHRCARSRPRGSTGWSRCAARRGVDAAAGQLIVREAGGLVSFPWCDEPLGAPLDRRADLARDRRALEPRRSASSRGSRRDRLDHRRADRHFRRRHRRRARARPPTWPRSPPRPRRASSPTPGWSPRGRSRRPRASAAASGWPATSTRCGCCSTRCSSARATTSGRSSRRCEIGMGIVLSTEVGVVRRLPGPARARPVRAGAARRGGRGPAPAAAVRAPEPRPGGRRRSAPRRSSS